MDKPKEEHPLSEELFATLIEREAQAIGVQVNVEELAAACLDDFRESVDQQAFDVVQGWLELRDSLPSWVNPTGDVPSVLETAGTRL